MNANSKCRHDT